MRAMARYDAQLNKLGVHESIRTALSLRLADHIQEVLFNVQ
jgi:hypothetical protein